jgi:hypothetical protein
LSSIAAYLSTAEAMLPSDHVWVESMKTARSEVLTELLQTGLNGV